MWLANVVRRQGLVRPDATALADESRSLTWAELDRRTDGVAAGLLAAGVVRGDRVAVGSRNRVEVVEFAIAAAKAGAVVCPVNPTFPQPEVEHILRNVSPVAWVGERATFGQWLHFDDAAERAPICLELGSEEYETMAERAGPRTHDLPQPDEPFAVIHTSATSGRARGVVLSHRAVGAGYTAVVQDFAVSADDVLLYPCPLYHGSMIVALAFLAAGASLVVQSEFTPQRFLRNIERFRPTRAFVVPSMIGFTLRARAFDSTDRSSLRELIFGGSPMPEDMLSETLARFGVPVRSSYGLTEAGPIATARHEPDSGGDVPARSAGRMHPGCHIELLTTAGRPAAVGELGEICVRTDATMSGYWRDPDATDAAIKSGRLHTGDIGRMDAAGWITLVARRGDVILRGGQNVYPAEVERVLLGHPGVLDAAVVAGPSSEWGQVPVAFVVAGPWYDVATLLAHCAAQLGSYKRPAAIHVLDEIPRNGGGKILRRVLKERLGNTIADVATARSA